MPTQVNILSISPLQFAITRHVVLTDTTPSLNARRDKDPTIPLNLSADVADDKKAKRSPSESDNVDQDRMKRVKSEQTEATDLSMKNSATSNAQNRPGNNTVRKSLYAL